MTRTTIHLMRHGEVHNPEGILYGRLPGYRLSEFGVAMAQRVAEVLSDGGHDITHVGASPLQRAQETARPTAERFGLELHTHEGLIEAGNEFEGFDVNRNRLMLAHPKFWWRYRNPLIPSWGESYRDQVHRMTDVIREVLHSSARGHEALLVSHQLPIWATRLFLERRPLAHDPRNRQCSLASLTSLTFHDDRLVGLAYWEPAGDLLMKASDMVPGTSVAQAAGTDEQP
ncbi:histidine phosphatase family protein [Bowdeniella nasicola]|uniref:Histidine phosphatase family protein n=1 Tax=Bowdeniella nasicola TaxID=208480 RepID=A0A1Q5Q2J7_9ACTO|nr:histidine phosphatase family protein [Bowdeniella nasicola]OKL53939.1 histidine phosphatase family protein [Bowdeniella nasicola]